MIDLHGRVVLITGAGGAIGSASPRTLATAGANVLAQDVRAEPVRRLVGEIGASARAFVSDRDSAGATESCSVDHLNLRAPREGVEAIKGRQAPRIFEWSRSEIHRCR